MAYLTPGASHSNHIYASHIHHFKFASYAATSFHAEGDRMTRLLNPDAIPPTLWNGRSQTICISSFLAEAYVSEIDSLNLRELSEARNDEKPPIGGATETETKTHFAQAFDGSAARVELVLLDPLSRMPDVSNAFVEATSGSDLYIIDAPAGAGAAAYSILCTIAQLRHDQILPRHPLNAHLLSAEHSPFAINIAANLASRLEPILSSQAIFLHHDTFKWDATDSINNAILLEKVTLESRSMKRFLVIANFNGFLASGGNKKKAMPQIEQLIHCASRHPMSLGVWIEPDSDKGRSLLKWLPTKLLNWRWVKQIFCDNIPYQWNEVRFLDPLSGQSRRVQACTIRFDLERP